MKASEFIEHLNKLINNNGDFDILVKHESIDGCDFDTPYIYEDFDDKEESVYVIA